MNQLKETRRRDGFQVLTEASVKMAVFWDVAPCSLIGVYRRFRGAYCLSSRPDDGRRATTQKTAIFKVKIIPVPKYHTIQKYEGVEVYIHTFLTSVVDRGELSASRLGRLTPQKEHLYWTSRRRVAGIQPRPSNP
jgi:hypothetical protein